MKRMKQRLANYFRIVHSTGKDLSARGFLLPLYLVGAPVAALTLLPFLLLEPETFDDPETLPES